MVASGFRSTQEIRGTTAYRYNTVQYVYYEFYANPMIYCGHYKFPYISFYLESPHPSPPSLGHLCLYHIHIISFTNLEQIDLSFFFSIFLKIVSVSPNFTVGQVASHFWFQFHVKQYDMRMQRCFIDPLAFLLHPISDCQVKNWEPVSH